MNWKRCILSRVKLMWTNYPNMPTGTCNLIPELYKRLVEFARRREHHPL